MRKLRMLLTLLMVSVCSWQGAWAQDVVVSVSLAQPGELGIEILRKHDPIAEVTDLTVEGDMNDEDWATLQLITNLKTLDLSKARCENMPEKQFANNQSTNDAKDLETVFLPSNLKTIGWRAFYYSKVKSVSIPSTLENIGEEAFYRCDQLETLNIKSLPTGIKVIPKNCFYNCFKLKEFTIPVGVTTIEYSAFANCSLFKSTLPATLTSIKGQAFYNAGMDNIDIVLSEGVQMENYSEFSGTKIRSIVFPTTYYYYNGGNSSPITNCSTLTDIYLKSPTVLSAGGNRFLSGCTNENLRIHVPAHLLEAYKVDSYFKDFSTQIVGDATVDAGAFWTILAPLTLSYNRMAGEPNIILRRNASLEVKGDAAQFFGNVLTYGHSYSSSYANGKKYGNNDWSMIINTCDNVSITGTLEHKIQTYEKKWYFFCLPFDFKVGDIVTENNIKYAIRYYDGYNRATVTTNNWKNYTADDVVPAGTGFILQTSATTWVTFKAQDNASKQNVMSNSAFTKALDDNDSETAANKGWNLVGNPWQSYYNIHKLNYTAPISVWDGSTYVAYSLTDDDYAIRPNEAFFVQSPGNNATIQFPTDGRQLAADITSQNGARGAEASERQIVDIQIAGDNELKDKTRLVVNPVASLDYELSCDAAKLMSMDGQVPQIYSLGLDDTQYAINERPADKGELRLGVVISQDGQYTISAIRNSLGQVLLRDNKAGITTDLSQNGYSFDAEQGTDESRFQLLFGNGLTAISHVKNAASEAVKVYTLDGREVSNSTDGLKQGVYVVRKGQKTQKVIIK